MDEDGLKDYLQNFQETFTQNATTLSVDDAWKKLKEAIVTAMDKFIPVKTISSAKHSLPWITHQIKSEIKKRNRLFKVAAKSSSIEDRQRYLKQKHFTQNLIRKSYWRHIESSISPTNKEEEPKNSIHKSFWTHIKAHKRDRSGTAPLKENGTLISDAKGKANILNRQYQSVF